MAIEDFEVDLRSRVVKNPPIIGPDHIHAFDKLGMAVRSNPPMGTYYCECGLSEERELSDYQMAYLEGAI